MEWESGKVKLVGRSSCGRRMWHRFRLTQDAPKMSEANRRVDSAEPNPVGVHKHPRSRSPQSFYFRYLEIWRLGVLAGVPIFLRNKRCSLAQQRGGGAQGGWWGVVSSKERSAHLLVEKCAPFKWEVRTSS